MDADSMWCLMNAIRSARQMTQYHSHGQLQEKRMPWMMPIERLCQEGTLKRTKWTQEAERLEEQQNALSRMQ
jgi:hypothetical protein